MTRLKLSTLSLSVIFFITSSGILKGQENHAEELYKALKDAKTDTVKIMAMYSLYLHYYQKSIDSAFSYAKRAYSLSKKNNDYELGRLAMAMGHAYTMNGTYNKSVEYLTEAYEIAKRLNYENIYAVLLNDIGLNFFYIEDYIKAEKYFKDALKVAKNYDGKYLSNFYLAQIKGVQGDYKEALNFFNITLELTKQEKNTQDEAAANCGLGDLYYDMEDYTTGITYYKKALTLFDSASIYYQVTSYSGIAEGYLQNGEYSKALEYCFLTDSLAKLGGFIYEQAEINEILSEVYENMGNKEQALEHYKIFTSLNDSLITVENNKHISYLHVEFDTKQKDLQLKLMEKDVLLKNRMLLTYILLSCLVFVTLAFWLNSFKAKNRRLELEGHKTHRQLTEKTTKMVQTMDFLEKLKSNINEFKNTGESNSNKLDDLVKEIQMFENQNVWNEFEHYFTEVHPDFFIALKKQCSTLTSNEVRLCAMLRLALSTKEIATITGKTPKSVDVMRTRIRNKMGLDRADKLYVILSGL
jgi:tetratricopeptide (TPR) repeat protein/DNA-binding CsgD family transcriptional regulator